MHLWECVCVRESVHAESFVAIRTPPLLPTLIWIIMRVRKATRRTNGTVKESEELLHAASYTAYHIRIVYKSNSITHWSLITCEFFAKRNKFAHICSGNNTIRGSKRSAELHTQRSRKKIKMREKSTRSLTFSEPFFLNVDLNCSCDWRMTRMASAGTNTHRTSSHQLAWRQQRMHRYVCKKIYQYIYKQYNECVLFVGVVAEAHCRTSFRMVFDWRKM